MLFAISKKKSLKSLLYKDDSHVALTNKECINGLLFSTEKSKWNAKDKKQLIPKRKRSSKRLLSWNARMRSVKENTYPCSRLTDTGERCWHTCDLFGCGWRSSPSLKQSKLWNTQKHLYLMPLNCHHNQSAWLLIYSMPPPSLFLSQHHARIWWNPLFGGVHSKPPSSF